MKHVLLALLACAVLLSGGWLVSKWTAGTGMPEAGEHFVRRYCEVSDLTPLSDLMTFDFQSGGVGDEYVRRHRVVRRHMGKFVEIERLLVNRVRVVAGARMGDLQFVGRFDKGTGIVKLHMVDFEQGWRVNDIEVEIPPSLMRRTPDEFAEMIALETVRRISRADFPALNPMTTQDFQLKYPGDVVAEAMMPLLEARGELEGLGVVHAETTGVNRRDTDVVALYKNGVPLSFELELVWNRNRWRVNDLSAEEAPGATVPPEALRGPVRKRRAPRRPQGN